MDYIESFRNLKPLKKYARKSPEKAVLLLVVIDLYDEGEISDNRIEYDETLAAAYRRLWNKLVPNDIMLLPNVSLAFWAMHVESFWHIVPVCGKEETIENLRSLPSTPSDSAIKDSVRYVELDEDLYFLMTLSSGRRSLKEALLETYFDLSSRRMETLSQVRVKDESPEFDFGSMMNSLGNKSNGARNVTDISIEGTIPDVDVEVWLTLCLSYYTFLKKHALVRDMFKESFMSPSAVYKFVLRQEDSTIPASLSDDVIAYLRDLQFSLMKDNNSMQIVDAISERINELEGVDTETEEYADYNQEPFVSEELSANDTEDFANDTKDDENVDDNGSIDNVDASQEIGEDFYVENYSSRCAIFNRETKKIYSSSGQLKAFEGEPYRLSLVYSKFSVNVLERNYDGKFATSKRIINASSNTALFSALEHSANYTASVWNILYDEETEDWIINVEGTWYNSVGDKTDILDEKETIEAEPIEEMEEQEVETPDEEEEPPFNYTPKGKLKKIEERVDSSYDYLWTMAIIDLVRLTNRNNSYSYDNIACMMLANAWDLLRNSAAAMESEPNLRDCINFLIDESKEEMEEPLTWKSTKEEVFNAIKDFPMYDVFEDTVDELLATSPLNVLKTWYSDLSDLDIAIEAINFTRPCLYALHLRKVDPYIEVNRNWLNNLYYEHDDLIKYFSIRYYKYINQ